ncbi:aldo/keto reductase family oxidoreductase [Hoeflea sp. TYP-13]|uniref:aldo/keto reductase family oxidoreductase n=1 Tax=Hoeflea sp. TYP-13 TaxID=3230023 RepID=UPI0034C6153D
MTPDQSPLAIDRQDTFLGREIGRLSYGCWRLPGAPQAEVAAKIDAALEIGANLIDTAAVYGFGGDGFGAAEAMLGKLIAERQSLRDDIVLVTKGGITPPLPYNSSAEHLIASCEASLQRLNCDHVDLFLVHRPDNLTGHAAVAEALGELVRSGKARAVGVSNYTLEQTRALQHFLDEPIVATQPEISAWCTETLFNGVLDHAQSASMLPMAWSPLAGGSLATGIAPGGSPDRFPDLIAVIDRIAGDNNSTRDCVALAWLLAHPAGIVPILGTQSPERIRAAAGAFDINMNRRDWYDILEASLGERMP